MPPIVRKHADRFSAWLILLMMVFALCTGARLPVPAWLAGVCAWAACALLWPSLDKRQRATAAVLIGIGLLALGWAGWRSGHWPWQGVLTQNMALLGMLAAVSFLQLIGLAGDDRPLPRGPGALWRTLGGVHVFGAVINLSAVFIMADRMSGGKSPSVVQTMALTRAFLAAALWSPFFAATAVAITYAPGATLGEMALAGVPLALLINYLAGRDLLKHAPEAQVFVGYPMRLSALWVPLGLAVMVVVGHYFWPHWTTLAIVSLCAPLMAVGVVLTRSGVTAGAAAVARHVHLRLPAMRGELVLFLAAAVFATGLDALIATQGGGLTPAHFGPLQSALVLAGMIGLCVIGVHAVISIAMVSAWLAPISPDPLLLAAVFTQCWAIGLAVSPMSGIHLALQGRYGLSAGALARGNARYCLQAYLAAVAVQVAIAGWRDLSF